MKEHFILDENAIILAHKLQNEGGEPDDTCLRLFQGIVVRCHAFVLCREIWSKYLHQLRTLERQRVPLVPGLMSLITGALRNLAKDTRYLPDDQLVEIEGLDELAGVDAGDRVFVRAAASVTGSILVTADGRLCSALRAAGIDVRYGFRPMTPSDALRYVETG